jgi:hypothetical protein
LGKILGQQLPEGGPGGDDRAQIEGQNLVGENLGIVEQGMIHKSIITRCIERMLPDTQGTIDAGKIVGGKQVSNLKQINSVKKTR